MSDSDVRITPRWLFDLLREFAADRYVFDVCTEPNNPLGAESFAFEGGLEIQWRCLNWCNWCNPPYSRGQVILWANKAIREALRGAEIIMLTQADVSTRWYRHLRDQSDAVCLLSRRVGFLKPDGEGGYVPMTGAKFGSAVWYWGRRRRRFARVFGAHGEVLTGLGPQERDDA